VKAVLDAAAFVAVDKGDRRMAARLRVLQQVRMPLSTSSAVIAQVWRDGPKQAHVARLLSGVAVRALGPGDDRRTGELLATARTSDVIDAHVALIVDDDDRVYTSDPDDIRRLVAARGVTATIVTV
jgi:hypothetical protein